MTPTQAEDYINKYWPIACLTKTEEIEVGVMYSFFTNTGDRYQFDYSDYKQDGWFLYTSETDAWYYGNWVNPSKMQTLAYLEGDIILIQCKDRDAYRQELQAMNVHFSKKAE